MDHYPTTYSDARGTETTTIANNGEELRLSLRGLEFVGSDFEGFEMPADATPEQRRQFSLDGFGCLCECRIECRIPIPIYDHGQEKRGDLVVEVIRGVSFRAGSPLSREKLQIALEYDNHRFAGDGQGGLFESELLGIQAQLPDGVFMKACINCQYSDYSPYGANTFGRMMCFRNIKTKYLLPVSTIDEVVSIQGQFDRFVQETYLCPEFERRTPGTGYRG